MPHTPARKERGTNVARTAQSRASTTALEGTLPLMRAARRRGAAAPRPDDRAGLHVCDAAVRIGRMRMEG